MLLSKEKFKIFQILMEEFSEKVRGVFSTQFKLSLEIEIESIRQAVFREVQEADEDSFLVVFNAPPLEGSSLLEIKLPFIIFFNRVLLGDALDAFPSPRLITPWV